MLMTIDLYSFASLTAEMQGKEATAMSLSYYSYQQSKD